MSEGQNIMHVSQAQNSQDNGASSSTMQSLQETGNEQGLEKEVVDACLAVINSV